MFGHKRHHKASDSSKSPKRASHRHSHKNPHSKPPKQGKDLSRSKSYEKKQRYHHKRSSHSRHRHHEKRRYKKSKDYEMEAPVFTEQDKQKQEARKHRFNQPIGQESKIEKQISLKQQEQFNQQQQEQQESEQQQQQQQQQQLAPRINLLAQPLTLQNFQQIAPLPKIQRPYQVSRQLRGNTKQISKEDLDNDLDDYFNFSKDNNENSNQQMDSSYNNFYFNQQQSQMQQYLQKQLIEERQKFQESQQQGTFYQPLNQEPLMTVKQLQEQQLQQQMQQMQQQQQQQQQQQNEQKPQESYKSWVEWNDDQDDEPAGQLSCEGLPGHFKIRLPCDLAKENSSIEFQIVKRKTLPDTDKDYGSNDKLNEQKNKITEIAEIWEKQIKFLISDFELIDIFRKDEIAMKRYNRSIINYSVGKDKLQPIFSRAYFKLWEIISGNKLLLKYFNKPMQIANLAEGPGGFIHCLVDYRNQQHKHPVRGWKHDEYYSITLKIKDKSQQSLDWEYFKSKKYFSMLDSQGYKVKLSYGASQDGDMLNTQNLRFFINYDLKDKKTNELKKCDLVTADGGIECSTNEEYAYQELLNVKLFFSEMITALAIQRIGGTYIMKIYDCFYRVTIQILVILAKYYQKVWITKPYTSRPASSERYLICENFQGIEAYQIEKLMQILEEWVEIENTVNYINSEEFVESFLSFEERENSKFKENLIKSNEDCVQSQMQKIEQGLALISKYQQNDQISIPEEEVLRVKKTQLEKALLWCRLHKVPHHENLELNK